MGPRRARVVVCGPAPAWLASWVPLSFCLACVRPLRSCHSPHTATLAPGGPISPHLLHGSISAHALASSTARTHARTTHRNLGRRTEHRTHVEDTNRHPRRLPGLYQQLSFCPDRNCNNTHLRTARPSHALTHAHPTRPGSSFHPRPRPQLQPQPHPQAARVLARPNPSFDVQAVLGTHSARTGSSHSASVPVALPLHSSSLHPQRTTTTRRMEPLCSL